MKCTQTSDGRTKDLEKRAYLVFFEFIHRAGSCSGHCASWDGEGTACGPLVECRRAWMPSNKAVGGAMYVGHDVWVLAARGVADAAQIFQSNANDKTKDRYIAIYFYTSDAEPVLGRVRFCSVDNKKNYRGAEWTQRMIWREWMMTHI